MKNLFNKIFGKADNAQSKVRPKDWNLTLTDLMNEFSSGKRKQIREPELTWAREYEKSLIPLDYRSPRKGDLYKSKRDLKVKFLTTWSTSYKGGGAATLYKDETIWIDSEPLEDKPIGVSALPVAYEKFEQRIMVSSERNTGKYTGYYLSIETILLYENFELIQENFIG
jgi:hypothetical protein